MAFLGKIDTFTKFVYSCALLLCVILLLLYSILTATFYWMTFPAILFLTTRRSFGFIWISHIAVSDKLAIVYKPHGVISTIYSTLHIWLKITNIFSLIKYSCVRPESTLVFNTFGKNLMISIIFHSTVKNRDFRQYRQRSHHSSEISKRQLMGAFLNPIVY